MALTQIRGEQIRDGIIKDSHISATAAIAYSKLNLAGQIVASDLNANKSVENAALDSKLITLWDMVTGVASGTGSSVTVTTAVQGAAATDTPQTAATAKGVLLTGSGTNGAGITNYKVQIRNSATGEPIADGTDSDPGAAANAATVYGELRHDGTDFTLYFFKSDGSAYTFASNTNIDILFLEVFSYLTAPVKGFIAGVGFADVVGISGSHNHHDLYYTQTQLDAGQLDNRYYTETELNNGQLDTRYYTETELSPSAETTGANVLDARYFRETELSSTASGSSGASLIGVTAGDGLAATTVQGALAELQGDINSLVSGGLDITHSLDDAYDDGSTIAVDSSNVSFNLTDTKKFIVGDSTGAAIVDVSALAAGDTLAVNAATTITGVTGITGATTVTGAFEVIGASTLDGVTMVGNLGQSGGSVTLNAESNAVDIDGGAVTVDGSSIALASTAGLTLKDQYLTSAIPLSQTNSTALATAKFAYDAQTDFNWTGRAIGNTAPTSVIAAVNANREDLYEYVELLRTQGVALGTAAGANLIGVDGITGVIPTGGSLGGNSNLQAMLEGIAMGAGGGKTFADEAAFTTAKAGGTYFKTNEPVFILDTNRWVIVLTSGTGVVEGTDFDYVGGSVRPITGSSYYINASSIELGDPTTANGLTIGSQVVLGRSDESVIVFDSSRGEEITATSELITLNAETVINGDFSITSDSAAMQIKANADSFITTSVDTNMIVTTSGTGEVQLSSADEIDLTGGAIDINAGTGYTVTIDSDTKVTTTSAVEVEINGGDVDINAGAGKSVTVDSDTLVALAGGVEVDLTATTLDFNGAVDHDGASFNSTVSGAFTVAATGDVDIGGDTVDLTASGASVGLNTDGKVSVAAATGQLVDISSDTEVQINGGALLDLDATVVTIDGTTTITAPVDQDITLNTTGNGDVVFNSDHKVWFDTPVAEFTGDVVIPDTDWLSVGNIKITSVDPTDHATITGARGGTLNVNNKLTNPGFEAGSGTNADSWTEGTGVTRVDSDKYYGSYSIKFSALDLASDRDLLVQATSGLTAATAHSVSFYVKGTIPGDIYVQLNAGAQVTIINGPQTYTSWTLVTATLGADNGASGDFKIIADGTGSEDYDFYIDAVTLAQGSTPIDFFSEYYSRLVFTIGDEDNDQIVMRSAGTTTKDLVRINQSTVEILGNLNVSGTTTTVNSQELLVADNQIVLNSGVTGAPSLDALITVERGTSADTSLRWNESSDKWELTNDGSNFYEIVTAGGGTGALSMDSAYDGGSTVAVDNTNVVFTMAASKSFALADGTDASKFVVSAGSGANSVKIDTTGGVDIDVDAGFTIDENSGSTFNMNTSGDVYLKAASTKSIIIEDVDSSSSVMLLTGKAIITSLTGTANDSVKINSTVGGIDIDAAATKPITIDSGSFSIDGVLASNVSVTGADLTLSTITSGDVNVSAAATLDVDATTSVTIDSPAINTTGVLTQTGDAQIIGDVNLDGDFDQTGNYTFKVDTTATAVDSLRINTAGGVDVDAAGTFALNAANINTTGSLVQTGATQVIGAMNLDGSIDADGADINLAASGTGGTHLQLSSADAASITAVGLTLEAGTGALTAQADAASLINVTEASLTLSTTTSGGVIISSAGAVTVDTGAAAGFSIDGLAASNVSVTGGNLTLSTITSGALALSSAGALTLKDQYLSSGLALSQTGVTGLSGFSTGTSIVGALNELRAEMTGSDTLDEIYDGETGTRVVTMDNGSVEWQVTDNYEFNVTEAAGADILSIKALATGDRVDVVAKFDVTGDTTLDATTVAGNLAQSGGTVILNATGVMDLDASGAFTVDAAGISLDATAASNFTVAGAALTLSTTGAYDVNLTSGKDVVVSATKLDVNASGAFELDGSSASYLNVNSADLTLKTTTSGSVVVTGVTGVDVDGAVIAIDGTAASHFTVTGNNLTLSTASSGNVILSAAGELTLKDSRTAAIPFSDAGATSLPGGATSILGALKVAYEGSIDIGYEEKTATSGDVTNDYVVLTLAELPTTGSFPASPSTMRAAGYHVAAYLNGLRLADTEWNYNYTGGEKRLTFNGTDDITLVSGDKVMVEVRVVK